MNDKTPTRLDPHTGRWSGLDLTIVSQKMAHEVMWEVLNENFGSDHSVVKCCFINHSKNSTSRDNGAKQQQDWSFRNVNWELYKKTISDKCLNKKVSESLEQLNIQGKYNLIINIINEAANETIKRVTIGGDKRGKKPVPWWNDKCEKAIKERNKFKNRLGRYYKMEDLIKYKEKKGICPKSKTRGKESILVEIL